MVGLTREVNPGIVAIIGAGPIGLFCQQAFRCLSAADVVVADLIRERLDVAGRLGARQTIDSAREDFVEEVLKLTAGEGADVVVDAVGGALSKKQSLAATRPGGTTVWIGLHENTVTISSERWFIALTEHRVSLSFPFIICHFFDSQRQMSLIVLPVTSTIAAGKKIFASSDRRIGVALFVSPLQYDKAWQ